MKNWPPKDEAKRGEISGPKSVNMKRRNNKAKNMTSGLSLEAFNAKSNRNYYNPALIKKQKEFYKNAKYVSKFKKSIKQQGQQNDLSSIIRPQEDDNETERNSEMMNKKSKKGKNKGKFSLKEIYDKKREEEEKEKMEREAIIQKQKEERENAKARRKAVKEKMYKKTRSGQPVMKYRIERLLETIQGSKSNNS
ncbi:hypothetical protein L484_020470 [Morus notabilis]|uniref:rRNA-processing protein FYV7 n=1 Tax=Morus notabilis TaxID=981085 RepID=W9SZQ0_9ROSA|nr:rRNA-processing protein FYV7 [Morus notabilis]EXC34698.1 hypothetical protein L484_020470 [Morus notabilis]